MRKRNHIIPLHLNKKELAHLETQVKQSGLPREEFLRTLIMGAELRAKPCDHHADLLHKVAGLCFAITPISLPRLRILMAKPASRAWRK